MNDRNFLRRCLVPFGLFVFIIIPWAGCSSYLNYKWKGALPSELKVGRTLARHTDFLGSPGGSCGGAIFSLKSESKERLETEGIGYLEMLAQTQRRGNKALFWIPVSSDFNIKYHFKCVISDYGSREKQSGLISAIRSQEAYLGYISENLDEVKIIILPEESLVLVGYWDN